MSPDRTTFIDTLYKEQKELTGFLQQKGELSFSQDVESYLSKTLTLSIASYFESEIINHITEFASRITHSDEKLISLVRIRVLDRKFSSFFKWSERGIGGATEFFGMFGNDYKTHCKSQIKSDAALSEALSAFLEIGELRNLLIHENFALYPFDKTADEVYELYRKAIEFLFFIECGLLGSESEEQMLDESELNNLAST